MGIGESIKTGHDEYRRFFAKLFKTTPKDAELREQLFTDFQRKLYAHHEAEELTILPRMTKIPDLRDMALELEVEHADMKVHFEALIKEGFDREIWRYKLAPLYDIMHAHWLKEEETMIPFGPDYFSKSEWEDFGKRFDEIVEDYLKNH
ncbi:MAG: hemerythrin domain-containing protein [Candidatus Bathyarchaeia archaeon]